MVDDPDTAIGIGCSEDGRIGAGSCIEMGRFDGKDESNIRSIAKVPMPLSNFTDIGTGDVERGKLSVTHGICKEVYVGVQVFGHHDAVGENDLAGCDGIRSPDVISTGQGKGAEGDGATDTGYGEACGNSAK